MTMTKTEIETKILAKEEELGNIPKLRKQINKEIAELYRNLEQAKMHELATAIEKAGVTYTDVYVALENGVIKPKKPVEAAQKTVVVKSEQDEIQEGGN